jgi:hypothetical protein
MEKSKSEQHTYIIVDPNKPGAVAGLLQRILLEKLRAVGSGSTVGK